MDLNLPNLEQQLNIFITTEELDELPGTDPTEAARRLRMGLRKGLHDSPVLQVPGKKPSHKGIV